MRDAKTPSMLAHRVTKVLFVVTALMFGSVAWYGLRQWLATVAETAYSTFCLFLLAAVFRGGTKARSLQLSWSQIGVKERSTDTLLSHWSADAKRLRLRWGWFFGIACSFYFMTFGPSSTPYEEGHDAPESVCEVLSVKHFGYTSEDVSVTSFEYRSTLHAMLDFLVRVLPFGVAGLGWAYIYYSSSGPIDEEQQRFLKTWPVWR